MPVSRFRSPFEQWVRGLLSELTAFLLFLGALFVLSALIVGVL